MNEPVKLEKAINLPTRTDYSVTYESGISNGRDTDMVTKVRRYGNVIVININVQSTSAFSTTYKTLFTLPEAIWPPANVFATANMGNSLWSAGTLGAAYADINGQVKVYCSATGMTFAKANIVYEI